MCYETLEILSPVMDKRDSDTGIFCWRRVGFRNVYERIPRGGRDCASGTYERNGIYFAPVSHRSRLFYPVYLRVSFLFFPQAEGGGTPASAFSAEPVFVSGDYVGNDSVNDTGIQLGN